MKGEAEGGEHRDRKINVKVIASDLLKEDTSLKWAHPRHDGEQEMALEGVKICNT